MELETRKNEARTELKHQDIEIEELLNRTIVTVSELRTDVEEMKWDIMRKAVGMLHPLRRYSNTQCRLQVLWLPLWSQLSYQWRSSHSANRSPNLHLLLARR